MVMVLAEHRRGEVRDVTFELLAKASDLAETGGSAVEAVLFAADVDGLLEPLQPWADEVLVAEEEAFENANADAYRQALGQLIQERSPDVVLVGHSSHGLDFAPKLAAGIDCPLVTNVEDCYWEDGELVTERAIYDGRVQSVVRTSEHGSAVLTAQAATFTAGDPPGCAGNVVEVEAPVDGGDVFATFLEYIEPETGDVDIATSDVLVSVGRGIEDEENLDLIEELADAMGADISGSRPVIDNGWLPSDRQVGQSGKTVTPDLYLAIGISGASQHVLGMKGSDTIVAINKDPDAPIFEVADYGIVDDLFDVVPALTEAIRERQ